MSALLTDLQAGDEVVLPSYTFSSTATAFALRGARLVFVDIDPRTLNIDPRAVARAIGPRTRAVVCMHYGGVACDLAALQQLAREAGVPLIEDAAQCFGATWNGQPLGTFGQFGTLSFHATKNVGCGEGGALLMNGADSSLLERAEIVREKGTNRGRFLRGEVDEYTWEEIGSSYLPSDFQMAVLVSQLGLADEITRKRTQV